MNAKEARKIINSFPPAFNSVALPGYYLEAKGYLAALDGPEVSPLVEAATGLSFGTDWNNGTHAKLHGYRQKLLDAIASFKTAKGEVKA